MTTINTQISHVFIHKIWQASYNIYDLGIQLQIFDHNIRHDMTQIKIWTLNEVVEEISRSCGQQHYTGVVYYDLRLSLTTNFVISFLCSYKVIITSQPVIIFSKSLTTREQKLLLSSISQYRVQIDYYLKKDNIQIKKLK